MFAPDTRPGSKWQALPYCRRAQVGGCRAGPGTVLSTSDRDRARCVRGEGSEIARVAGEDDRAGARAGECGYDGVGCGDCRGPASGGAQPGRLAGVRLGHVPDLAGAQ